VTPVLELFLDPLAHNEREIGIDSYVAVIEQFVEIAP
jgi:hypothetical protein